MSKTLLASYVAVAALAGAAGATLAWQAHPDGIEQREFHGVVLNVDSDQKAIGVRTTDYGRVAGSLVNDGTALKPGQTVGGVLYGPDAQIIEVTSTH